MNLNQTFNLILRYFILVIFAISNLSILYTIFTPLTIYPVFIILKGIYGSVILQNSEMLINKEVIRLIPACIAGSAYYFLLILNLSTPMKPKTRVYSLIFLISSFLILNIIRIIVFSVLALSGFSYFDLAHKLTWYLGSTILIVILWFGNIYLFKIKSIPFYTDLKEIYKDIKWY